MTVYVTKVGSSFYQTTIQQAIETFPIGGSRSAIALQYAPIDPAKVQACLYSASGDRYPQLENYNLSNQDNADFDIVQPHAPTNMTYYLRWWAGEASHLSTPRFPNGSKLIVNYDYKTLGDRVIADSEEIAQAVWQENTPNDIASAVWSQNSPESIQSGAAQAVWNTTIQNQNASEIMRRIYQINSGAWKLDTETRRLKFYDSDGTTVLFEFDMLDAQGNATISSVFERRPAS